MHTVYASFDADNTSLYVGQTTRLDTRLREHARDHAWWQQAAYMHHCEVATARDATNVERMMIGMFHPAHNIRHNIHEPWSKGITR